MYKNFKEYWAAKKDMYTQLGVSESAAHSIWCDACDAVVFAAIERELNK